MERASEAASEYRSRSIETLERSAINSLCNLRGEVRSEKGPKDQHPVDAAIENLRFLQDKLLRVEPLVTLMQRSNNCLLLCFSRPWKSFPWVTEVIVLIPDSVRLVVTDSYEFSAGTKEDLELTNEVICQNWDRGEHKNLIRKFARMTTEDIIKAVEKDIRKQGRASFFSQLPF